MKRARGFTLIELLIVVAIIAIMAAATLALFVAPLREHARVQIVGAAEGGLALAIEALTRDAHGAIRIEDDGRIVRFRRPAGATEAVYVREGATLRRLLVPRSEAPNPEPGRGAALVANLVQADFLPSADGRQLSIHLRTAGVTDDEFSQREARWTVCLLDQPEVQP